MSSKTGTIGCPETSLTTNQRRNIPDDRRPPLRRGYSLQSPLPSLVHFIEHWPHRNVFQTKGRGNVPNMGMYF